MSKSIVKIKLLVFLIALSFIGLSCVPKKDIIYFQNAKNFETMVDTDTFNAKLKIGDIVNIFISTPNPSVAIPYNIVETDGNQSRTIDYLIDSEGNIDYPVLGKIKLVGLTIEEAKQLFKKKFKEGELLKDPVVIIRINNYRVFVFGEVSSPGVYPISGERVTILEALAMAGDLSITGKRDNIMVIRDFDGTKTFTRIDLTNKEVFNSPVYYLTQNDVIYVEPNTKALSGASGDNRIGLFVSLTGVLLTIVLLIQNLGG